MVVPQQGPPPQEGAAANDAADVAAWMRAVVGRLGRALRMTHADHDLSPGQHEVLGTIVRRGPMRLSELAVVEGLNPTMLSRIAGKLEAAGLVTRTTDPRDGRVAHLAPTSSGRELYEEIRAERADALRRAFSDLSGGERRALTRALPVLESLAESLRRQTK